MLSNLYDQILKEKNVRGLTSGPRHKISGKRHRVLVFHSSITITLSFVLLNGHLNSSIECGCFRKLEAGGRIENGLRVRPGGRQMRASVLNQTWGKPLKKLGTLFPPIFDNVDILGMQALKMDLDGGLKWVENCWQENRCAGRNNLN